MRFGRGGSSTLRPDVELISPLAVLDRPRRHVHRRGRTTPRRRHRRAQAPFRGPRALPRRRGRGDSPFVGHGARSADCRRGDRGRQDGHDGRDQCASRAQGGAHGALHHARFSRRLAHRLPEPPAPLRPAHRAARAAVYEGRRSRGAPRRAGRSPRGARRGERAPRSGSGIRRRLPVDRDRAHARLPPPGARKADRRARTLDRLRAGIGFDMGGTSTDVSHYAGELERAFETQVAGVRMRAPMMSIHTVAAGGGSILHFDGSRYRVGPDSAGADPGPASYRRNGPLTVTDANVMLGKIQPKFFPAVFGPQGDASLDDAAVRAKFAALAGEIRRATGDTRSPEQVAEGFIEIAVGNMAEAIKKISVQRGHDVTEYTLCCFGGAAGQHACLVADALGMTRVFIHPLAGVLSAYGMGLADTTAMREESLEVKLEPDKLGVLAGALENLSRSAQDELISQGVPRARLR